MLYLFSILLGYLIGSIPTSYLLVKLFTGRVLYDEGSKNIGAMNSYEITQNKIIGIVCAIADGMKGIISIILAVFIFQQDIYILFSLFGAVLGHNYSLYIKFRGGRGLSTTAFGLLLINPIGVFCWLIIFALSKVFISKNVHINNTIATILSLISVAIIPEKIFNLTNSYFKLSYQMYLFLLVGLSVLILARHLEPLKDIARS